MAVILNEKKSSVGSPYVYYTVEASYSNRTTTTVDITVKVTSHLASSSSILGTGSSYGLTGYITLNGKETGITLKGTSERWEGTTKHSVSKKITVTGLQPTQTSITNVKFRAIRSNNSTSNAGYLPSTSCSNISIPIGHRAPANVSYTIIETNQQLLDIGIDNNTFVENLSRKEFDVTATLYDNASVSKYTITNNNVNYTSTSTPIIIDFGQIALSKVSSKVPISATVLDTLGSSTKTGVTSFDYIPYIKTNLVETSTTAKRNGQLSGKVWLNISGNFYNGIIGIINQTEYIPIIKYKYWKAKDEEPLEFSHTIAQENISISDSTFSVSNLEIGTTDETAENWFNPDEAYRIRIYVEDNLTSYTSQIKSIPVGEATWTEYKDRVDFKKLTIKGDNVVAPRVGDIIITSTNNDPKIDYGGIWELIDKEFLPIYIYSSDTTYLTRNNISGATIRIRRSGHSISVGISMTVNTEVYDDTIVLGTLKLSAMGMKSKSGMDWISAWTDGGNNIVMMNVSENTEGNCTVSTVDVSSTSKIQPGEAIGFSHTFVAESIDSMDDKACNKFDWKRTA